MLHKNIFKKGKNIEIRENSERFSRSRLKKCQKRNEFYIAIISEGLVKGEN